MTHKIIVLSSLQYQVTISFVILSISLGWFPIGIQVIPGKSIRVRSTVFLSKTYKTIGLSTIP